MQVIDGKCTSTTTDDAIKGFFGEYSFLSNFHECKVKLDGLEFGSSEAAYMSTKFKDRETKLVLATLSPKGAKDYSNNITMSYSKAEWEQIRLMHMYRAVYAKFSQNFSLAMDLVHTRDKYLEETNDWNDVFWGVSQGGHGANMLGKILMLVRDELIQCKVKELAEMIASATTHNTLKEKGLFKNTTGLVESLVKVADVIPDSHCSKCGEHWDDHEKGLTLPYCKDGV